MAKAKKVPVPNSACYCGGDIDDIFLPTRPIPEGTELELATRLLRELHPKHDLARHSVCIMCVQIEALESTFAKHTHINPEDRVNGCPACELRAIRGVRRAK